MDAQAVSLEIQQGEEALIKALAAFTASATPVKSSSTDQQHGAIMLAQARRVRDLHLRVVKQDFALAVQLQLDAHLWKSCVYRVIEALRGEIRRGRGEKSVRLLGIFLDESRAHYYAIIAHITHTFQIRLPGAGVYPPMETLPSTHAPDGEDARATLLHEAYRSCHQCVVFLGDLARYAELHNDMIKEKTFRTARMLYEAALRILPDCGNPHNQLAVLATYSRDYSLACMHYMCGVLAPEPFPTAVENLCKLFGTVNEKIDAHELSESEEEEDEEEEDDAQRERRKSSGKHKGKGKSARRGKALSTEEERSTVWPLMYLTQVHATIFTCDDQEAFSFVQENWPATVTEVSDFLSQSLPQPRILSHTSMKIAIMAIFSLHHVEKETEKAKNGERVSSSLIPEARSFAIRVFFDSLNLLLSVSSKGSAASTEAKAHLAGGIKLMCDFLRLYPSIWPLSLPCDSLIWVTLSQYLNSLRHNASHASTCSASWKQQALLPEDEDMRGFIPLKGAVSKPLAPGLKTRVSEQESIAYRELVLLSFGVWLSEKVRVPLSDDDKETLVPPLVLARIANDVVPLHFSPNTGKQQQQQQQQQLYSQQGTQQHQQYHPWQFSIQSQESTPVVPQKLSSSSSVSSQQQDHVQRNQEQQKHENQQSMPGPPPLLEDEDEDEPSIQGPPPLLEDEDEPSVSGPPPLLEDEDEVEGETIVFRAKKPESSGVGLVSPSRVIHAVAAANSIRKGANDFRGQSAMEWISGRK